MNAQSSGGKETLSIEAQVGGTLARSMETVGGENRVTVYSWEALAGSVIGYSMDGFDQMILGFMLPSISAELALTSTQASSLLDSGAQGQSARISRRRAR